MTYLPKLKQWLDEAKVKRDYYRAGSEAREQLEVHITSLEKTIQQIEHPEAIPPREPGDDPE